MGGYLVPPEMLPKITSLISFGVNVDWRFEQELNDDFKISVAMFDCSLVFRLVILFCIKGVAKFLLFKSNLNELSGRFKRIYSYFHFIHRTNVSLSQLLITADTAEQIFQRLNLMHYLNVTLKVRNTIYLNHYYCIKINLI